MWYFLTAFVAGLAGLFCGTSIRAGAQYDINFEQERLEEILVRNNLCWQCGKQQHPDDLTVWENHYVCWNCHELITSQVRREYVETRA